jgi:RNA polymerase sigma factor (sigma-70 family)
MLPSEEAAAYRACTDDVARAQARERLAAAVRKRVIEVLGRTLRGRAIAGQADLDDAAQYVTVRLVDRIAASKIEHGEEDRYVFRAARNKATDMLRGRADPRRFEIPKDQVDSAADDPFGDRLAADTATASLDRIEAALAEAPPAYRDVIVRLFLEEETRDSLVDRELVTRGQNPNDADARRLAANVIDQRVARARKWLRLRIGAVDG